MESDSEDSVNINIVKLRSPSSLSSSSSESRVERIKFIFIYDKIIVEQYQNDQNLTEFVRERQQQQPTFNFVWINAPQVFEDSDKSIYTTLERELSGWDLSDYWRERVIKNVLCSTRDMLKSISPGHELLGVCARVTIKQNRIFSLSDHAMDLMVQQSIEDSEVSMVPAMNSSIDELLEKKILMSCDDVDCESCRICLDEFSTGCVGVRMPCSHVFHGDCIEKWLRTSHICPICRFEMPTS